MFDGDSLGVCAPNCLSSSSKDSILKTMFLADGSITSRVIPTICVKRKCIEANKRTAQSVVQQDHIGPVPRMKARAVCYAIVIDNKGHLQSLSTPIGVILANSDAPKAIFDVTRIDTVMFDASESFVCDEASTVCLCKVVSFDPLLKSSEYSGVMYWGGNFTPLHPCSE